MMVSFSESCFILLKIWINSIKLFSPQIAVFGIVQFLFAPKSTLFGDFLYLQSYTPMAKKMYTPIQDLVSYIISTM